jgi:23S rRNA pseudouridine2605 synthase
VGRLDRSSEGLIVVTNDGRLADQLTHPRYGVQKTYAVRVAGSPEPAQLDALRKGVRLAEGVAHVVALRVKGRQKQTTDLEIVLNEGRNREIRRILARIGHKVLSLRRIAVGTLRIGKLPVGASRKLTLEEIHRLEQCVGKSPERSARAGKPHHSSKGNRRR